MLYTNDDFIRRMRQRCTACLYADSDHTFGTFNFDTLSLHLDQIKWFFGHKLVDNWSLELNK